MGKFKKRVAANKTSYAQRNEAMDAMRTLQLRRVNPMLLGLAIHLDHSYDTHDASYIEETSDAFTAILLCWINLSYYEVPSRIPHPIRPKVTIASFSDHRTLFRFRTGTQLTRLYHCLKTDLADENGDVRINDGYRTHLFTFEEILLFALHRFAHGTSMEISRLSFFSCRDQSAWSRAWSWFICRVAQKWGPLVQNNLAAYMHYIEPSCRALCEMANFHANIYGWDREYGLVYDERNFSISCFLDCSDFNSTRMGAGPIESGPFAARRPDAHHLQKCVYGGHHHIHGVKYEAVVLPNGLSMSFQGPFASRRQDRFVTSFTKLNDNFEAAQRQFLNEEGIAPDEQRLHCAYGDRIYVNGSVIRRAHFAPSDKEKAENTVMNKMRTSVEHYFGLEKETLFNLLHQPLDILRELNRFIPLVGCILTNAYTCLNANQLSVRYNMMPPSIEEWFETLPNN